MRLLEILVMMVLLSSLSIVFAVQNGGDPYILLVSLSGGLSFIVLKTILGNSMRFSCVTIPSFFMFAYIILMCFGSVNIFSQMTHPVKHVYFIAIQSVLVTFPLGVLAANSFFPNHSVRISDYVNSEIKVGRQDARFTTVLGWSMVAAVPVLYSYFYYSTYVQLLEVIKAYPTPIDVWTLKNAGSDDLPRVVQYAFELLRRLILPISVLYAYFMYSSERAGWGFRFGALLVFSLFVSALTLDRAPPVAMVFMFILAFGIRRRGQRLFDWLNFKAIGVLAAAMAIGGLISVLQYQSEFSVVRIASSSAYVFYYRIMQDAPYMASTAFETFNSSTYFLHGQHMRIFSFLPGFEYTPSLGVLYSPAAPVGFVADLWRNFGWCGVIIGPFIIGVFYQYLQLSFFRRKSPAVLSLQVLLLVGSIWIIHGNVLGVMSTSVMLLGGGIGCLLRSWEDSTPHSV